MASSVERSASATTTTEYALRLELATERQKRHLAEERNRQMEDRLGMHQSSAALLAKAMDERRTMDDEAHALRDAVEELRNDNEALASMVETLSQDVTSTKRQVAEVSGERDGHRREVFKARAEITQLEENRDKLEIQLSDHTKRISMLVAELGERESVHSELQGHFKALTEKARSTMQEKSDIEVRCSQLERELQQARSAAHEAEATRMFLALQHLETVRRFTTMLMAEEQRQVLYQAAWRACARGVLPHVERCLQLAHHDIEELEGEVSHVRSTLQQTLDDIQLQERTRRAAITGNAVQTEMTAHDLQLVMDERDQCVDSLRVLACAKANLVDELHCAQTELEARRQALLRIQSNRKTPALPSSDVALPLTPTSAPPRHAVRADDDSISSACNLEGLFHRGESLVLKQRMDTMVQRMLQQATVYEQALQDKERLQEALSAALDERDRLNSQLLVGKGEGSASAQTQQKNYRQTQDYVDHDMKRVFEDLDSKLKLAHEQLLDACRERDAMVSERDRALREVSNVRQQLASSQLDVASYCKSLEELQAHLQAIEGSRIPKEVHLQELHCVQSARSEVQARYNACERQLSQERSRRLELEEEVASLQTLQGLATWQDQCRQLTEEKEAVLRCLNSAREEAQQHCDLQLQERDRLLADAGRKMIDASEEMDAMEQERGLLVRECQVLRDRIGALLALQDTTARPRQGY